MGYAKKVWNKQIALNYIKSRVVETGSGCHEWQGPLTSDGYGQIGATGLYDLYGIRGVHRLVVHLVTGHVFAGRHEQVMHSCHNRSCCNPDHLSIGTAAENAQDRMAYHREAGISYAPRGEDHPNAKLTTEEVKTIKWLLDNDMKGNAIARAFRVSDNQISQIKRGKSWSHVTI